MNSIHYKQLAQTKEKSSFVFSTPMLLWIIDAHWE
jgi:hypothetical protein